MNLVKKILLVISLIVSCIIFKQILSNKDDKNILDIFPNILTRENFVNTPKKEDRNRIVTKTMNSYVNKNKECFKRSQKDAEFMKRLTKAFEVYMKSDMKKKLGYMPEKTDLNKMSSKMFAAYIETLKNIPNCKVLIDNYSNKLKNKDNRKNENVIPEEVIPEEEILPEEEGIPEEERVVSEEEEGIPEEESIISEEEILPEEEGIPVERRVVPEEDGKSNRDKAVGKIMDKYLANNKTCYKKIKNNDKVYYNKFQKAFERFTKETFQKKLGYIPQKSDLNKMEQKEFDMYVHILNNLPKCENLINKYTSKKDTIIHKPKQTTTISSHVDGSIPSITTVINTNRGVPNNNSHGDRRLTPTKAPYMHYIKNIGNQLQNITFKLDKLTSNKKQKNIIDKEKYLRKEKNIIEKIQSEVKIDKATKMVENANDKLYVTAKNTKNKLFNDRENKVKIGANFNYKPLVKFTHMEPKKNMAAAYGWSFMPPSSWSVPQKRPPVCIPQNGKQAMVTPVFDKGTPVDALSWTQSNSNLPKVEYT